MHQNKFLDLQSSSWDLWTLEVLMPNHDNFGNCKNDARFQILHWTIFQSTTQQFRDPINPSSFWRFVISCGKIQWESLYFMFSRSRVLSKYEL